MLVLPAFIIYAWMVLVPSVQTFYISFTQWEGLGPKTWVALSNYAKMFSQDEWPVIWAALKNNFVWAIVAVTVPVWIDSCSHPALCAADEKAQRSHDLFSPRWCPHRGGDCMGNGSKP